MLKYLAGTTIVKSVLTLYYTQPNPGNLQRFSSLRNIQMNIKIVCFFKDFKCIDWQVDLNSSDPVLGVAKS
jgi:hypothetical protein